MEREDIEKWVKQNAEGLMPEIPLAPDEIEHIAMCMHHIHRWYYEGYPIGDFLTAIVRNDFMEACIRADVGNRKALYLYALFLANKIPWEYVKKARRGKQSWQTDSHYAVRNGISSIAMTTPSRR